MQQLNFKSLPYIMVIEGHDLGNGKTTLAVAFCLHYASKGVKIASNMELKGIPYFHISTEEQLFTLRNHLIILDEADIYFGMDDKLSGKMYYNEMIKHCRKRRNKIMMVTQDIALIHKRVRAMVKIICYPRIEPLLEIEQMIKWNGKVYESKVIPISKLKFQWFQYDDRRKGAIRVGNILKNFGKQYFFDDVMDYFELYDTEQEYTFLFPDNERRKKYGKIKEDEED